MVSPVGLTLITGNWCEGCAQGNAPELVRESDEEQPARFKGEN